MDKNDSFTPQEKKDNNKQTVIIPLMVMAVLLIVDLYVMINMPGNYLVLIVVTILFLVSAYFLGNGILKEIQNNKMRADEQYEAITKSGKASYILLKKAFEQLEEIEGNSKKPAEDIITAQKAIAKVTISRNKENTDALMNSNDKVLEKIFDFEENLGSNQNDLLNKQRDIIDNSMKALMQQQQEMAYNMKAMEESIKNELLQAMNSMQVAQPTQTVADFGLSETEPALDFDLGESESMTDIGLGDMDSISDLNLGDTETVLDFDLSESEPIADLDLGETEPALDLDLGETEPIADLDLGETEPALDLDLGETEPALDFNLGETEPIADLDLGETGLDDSLGLGVDINIGEDINLGADLNIGEDINIGADLDLSLSEDLNLGEPEIPADMDLGVDLLSDEETTVEEPVAEEVIEESVVEDTVEEPVPAEKEDSAMPDLSDPHKLMTPEEIAALIANM